MNSIYQRRIARIINGKFPVYNTTLKNKRIKWTDIINKYNINNITVPNDFALLAYKYLNSNNIFYNIKNNLLEINNIQDDGTLLFIKNIKDFNYDNIQLDNNEYTSIQLQLDYLNLNKCKIFYNIIQKNNNNDDNNSIYEIFENNKKIICNNNFKLIDYSIVDLNKNNIFLKDLLNNFINDTSLKEVVEEKDYKKNIKRKKKEKEILNVNKKRKLDIDWSQWVSASKIRNYLLKDPLLDWLHLKKYPSTCSSTSSSSNFNSFQKNNNDFTSYILNKGIEYENTIIEIIKKKFSKYFIQIGESYEARDNEKYQNTISAMVEGIPIIYQGVLHNEDNQTYGVPDLIVRSDYINKLTDEPSIGLDEEHISAPNFDNKCNYHYRIIDIKSCMLHLTANGINLLNSGSMSAYKGQLYIYTLAIGKIMGYIPPAAYILGKRWSFTQSKQKYEGDNSFDRLGKIDYETFDKQYISIVNDAIDWIKNLNKNGCKWKIIDENNGGQPTVPELYPNMTNQYDGIWKKEKDNIANQLNEITMLWQCGVKQRNIAHLNKIYSWKDKKCTSKKLGITGNIKSKVLDAMLKINKSSSKQIITWNIKNNDGEWQKQPKLEFYVDFETINSVCTDGDTIIFMIGVGYEYNNKWNFMTFLAKDNTIDEEKIMVTNFFKYITKIKNEILGKSSKYPNLYHWGNIEQSLFKTIIARHNVLEWTKLNWFDMLNVFKKEPIVIKDCLNFGLKNVAKTMYKHGFINTCWNDMSKCSNGINAMIYAYNEYEKNKELKYPIKNNEIMVEIAEYNEIDCKVIWEIVSYLRNNL
jgi:hypothetical protein